MSTVFYRYFHVEEKIQTGHAAVFNSSDGDQSLCLSLQSVISPAVGFQVGVPVPEQADGDWRCCSWSTPPPAPPILGSHLSDSGLELMYPVIHVNCSAVS